MTTPYAFRLSANRKSFPWDDIELPYANISEIESIFSEVEDFQQFIDVPTSLRDLYLGRIREIFDSNGLEFIVGRDVVQIVSNTDNILHIKIGFRVVYGDRQLANENYILKLDGWHYAPGGTTFEVGAPCVEDYVFELRFMEK